MTALMQAALGYAERGWAVFPLKPRSKEPATAHGVLDATLDPAQIARWWTEDAERNIGIAMGPSCLAVLDVDPRNGGSTPTETLGDPDTPMVMTPTGGSHVYYDDAPVVGLKVRKTAGEGLDFQTKNKYVVAPPSVHPEGGVYRWLPGSDAAPIPVPEWLVARVEKPEPTQAQGQQDPNGTRPGDYFNRDADYSFLLDHGWKKADVGEDGEQFWTRPGKDSGTSASTGYNGTNLMWVFTSSTEFEADTSYTPFAAYTLLTQGGLEPDDYAEAAKSLADRQGASTMKFTKKSDLTKVGGQAWHENVDHRTGEVEVVESDEPVYGFAPAYDETHWVQRYVEYAAAQTDAALEYHEAVGLSILATVTAGVRCRLAPFPNGLPCNLYLLMAGPSTRSRKSTSARIGADLLNVVYPGCVLPDRMTGEGSIFLLAGKSGTPVNWMPDEFGMTIAEMGNRDFMRVLEQVLLTLYAGDPYEYTKVDGSITIKDLALNVMGAATPESLALAGSSTAVLGGLMPRFGIVYPPAVPPLREIQATPDLKAERAALIQGLREIQARVQTPGASKEVEFSDDALAMLNAAEHDVAGEVVTARLGTALYKVAALNALARAESVALVSAEDAASAIKVVTRWAEGAGRLRPILRRKASDIEFDGVLRDIINTLKDFGGTSPRSRVTKKLRIEPRLAARARDALVEWDEMSFGFDDANKEHWSVT
jgi:hypothetical protein